MRRNKLREFLNNSDKISKYHAALKLLSDAGVEEVLIELGGSVEKLDPAHPNSIQVAATEQYKSLGYNRCLELLYSLTSLDPNSNASESPDYGAIEKMLAEGRITEEQAEQLRNEF